MAHRHSPSNLRGVTLIEVLVVVAIMTLIAAAVGVPAYIHYDQTKDRVALSGAREVRKAVKLYWVATGDARCPSLQELTTAQFLDEDSPHRDPWGSPWRIDCDGARVSVHSAGRDRRHDTEDDVRVPPV